MSKQLFRLSIDVNKIDKSKLFKGKKGTYLSALLVVKEEPDQYGNIGFIVESGNSEDQKSGQQGTIIGNAKSVQAKSTVAVQADNNDLPF